MVAGNLRPLEAFFKGFFFPPAAPFLGMFLCDLFLKSFGACRSVRVADVATTSGGPIV